MNKFYRFILKYSESNMYITIENNKALIIDPNKSEEALLLLRENEVKEVCVLLTHEHFDHITGVNWLKEHFCTEVICHKNAAISVMSSKNNRPFVFMPMVEDVTEDEKREIISFFDALPTDSIEADTIFESAYEFEWQGHKLKLTHCPGHSRGSVLINFDDTHIFTGDYMIPGAPVILRFPGGDKEAYKRETLPRLLSLNEKLTVMPGHGEPYLHGKLLYEKGKFVRENNY